MDPAFSLTPVDERRPYKKQHGRQKKANLAVHYAEHDLGRRAHMPIMKEPISVHLKRWGSRYGNTQRANALAHKRLFGTWAGGNDTDGNSFKAAVLALETIIKGVFEGHSIRHLDVLRTAAPEPTRQRLNSAITLDRDFRARTKRSRKDNIGKTKSRKWQPCRDRKSVRHQAGKPKSRFHAVHDPIR